MDTKKFNSNEKSRGGQNNTKTILTASGLSALAGAASGATIALKFCIRKKDDKDDKQQDNTPVTEVKSEVSQHDVPQHPLETHQSQPSCTSNDNITTPQPTDSTGDTEHASEHVHPQQQTQTQNTSSDGVEIDPDLIAQQIVSSTETDPMDIEATNILTVDGMEVAYGPDGAEFTVAMVHTPDGGQYMLADIDGDGIYSDVFDLRGEYVGEAEGNLTASDLQEAADPTGGYMAFNGNEPIGEDPTDDIIATDTTYSTESQDPNDNLLASDDEETADLEDLLSQLLNTNEDSLCDIANQDMVVDETCLSDEEKLFDDNEDNYEDSCEEELDNNDEDE